MRFILMNPENATLGLGQSETPTALYSVESTWSISVTFFGSLRAEVM